MRNIDKTDDTLWTDRDMAGLAAEYAEIAMDSYSEYGVGAVLRFNIHGEDYVYAGCNINLSGMEYKVHAEQLALFQALMDIRTITSLGPDEGYETKNVKLESVVVVTTDNDQAIRCGHCFQVLNGACSFLDCDPDDVTYIGASARNLYGGDGKPEGVHWNYRRTTLADEFIDSYVDTRNAE